MPNCTPTAKVEVDAGDTAWLLAASAQIMLMTPGLAFFYGGLVRDKNIINTMMMSFSVLGIVTVHFILIGYSLAYGAGNSFIGGINYGCLQNVGLMPNPSYSASIPHLVYMVNQMMFAVITPALISGAVVERISFRAYLIFVLCWTTFAYDMVAHWIWSAWYEDVNGCMEIKYGWLRHLGALDFAGGTTVHISSGISGLMAALIVGRRQDLLPEVSAPPSKPSYVVLGASLLWFGWFGFNGGSALSAGTLAGLAFVNTQISTGTAYTTWLILDLVLQKQASAVGAMCGAVIGLVAITPAAGYVHPMSSTCIGGVTCLVCYTAVRMKSKYAPRYFSQLDDSLDVFTCHGIGGTMGCLFTGLFASLDVNPKGGNGAFFGNPMLLVWQLVAVLVTTMWCVVITTVILLILRSTIGLKVSQEALYSGLDVQFHGINDTPHDD